MYERRIMNTVFLATGLMLMVGSFRPGAHGEPKMSTDYATFRADSGGNTLVEIALKLSTDSLGIVEGDDQEMVSVLFTVTVEDSTGSVLLTDKWERRLGKPPQSSGPGHEVYFLDSSSLELLPGLYTLMVSSLDRSSGREVSLRRDLPVPSYSAPGLLISDLLLSSTEPSPEAGGQFVRNGFRVVPSPDGTFGARSSLLYVYQEIYNLRARAAVQDSFEINYRIRDPSGQEVRRYTPMRGRNRMDRAVKIARISLAGVPPGSYVLEATVEDLASSLRTRTTREFILEPLLVGTVETEELTDEIYEKSLHLLAYVASSRERSLLSELDDTGKRTFVERYWAALDQESALSGNVHRDELLRRYDFANEHYGGHDEGWRTDRGRVYIVYGPPEEIERHTSNPGTRDYEIWMYAFEGEARFIFVDERGYGQYRLVHSTARGELQYPEWETLIKPVDDDRGNLNP